MEMGKKQSEVLKKQVLTLFSAVIVILVIMNSAISKEYIKMLNVTKPRNDLLKNWFLSQRTSCK